jgi:hypothetical protein
MRSGLCWSPSIDRRSRAADNQEDTGELMRMWWCWFGDVDLAIVPRATITG